MVNAKLVQVHADNLTSWRGIDPIRRAEQARDEATTHRTRSLWDAVIVEIAHRRSRHIR
jgi:hypothetical protein